MADVEVSLKSFHFSNGPFCLLDALALAVVSGRNISQTRAGCADVKKREIEIDLLGDLFIPFQLSNLADTEAASCNQLFVKNGLLKCPPSMIHIATSEPFLIISILSTCSAQSPRLPIS